MYEDQIYSTILSRMLNNLDSKIDKREGSVAFDMLSPKAIELAQAYISLNQVLDYGFVNTTYGSYLDNKVSEAGLTRYAALTATGSITFTGTTNGVIIPKGSIVYTNSGIQFTTDTACTITSGTATVTITAVTAGISGNVANGLITNTQVSQITCTNAAATIGGSDIETDPALLKRYLDRVQKPGTSGNISDYYNWATSVIGIGDAKVEPLWNGNGTVKVIVISTSKQQVDSTTLTNVTNTINTNKPIGATVTVISAIDKIINISATLTLQAGVTAISLQQPITDAIASYFTSATFVDTEIKYSKVGAMILSINGVVDYSNLQINGGTVNIPLTDTDIPTVGTVTLS